MAEVRETGQLPMGEGCLMRFMINDAEPKDSIHHHWTQTSYDGAPNSWVPEIGSHWHKHHDEYMEVLQGRIAFTLDGKGTILKAGDGPLHIPRLHVHSFKFFKGEPTTFTERTDPPGSFKEEFFTDLLEVGKPTVVTAMRSFYDGDCYAALPGGFKLLDEAFITVVGGVMKWLYPYKRAVVPSADAAMREGVVTK